MSRPTASTDNTLTDEEYQLRRSSLVPWVDNVPSDWISSDTILSAIEAKILEHSDDLPPFPYQLTDSKKRSTEARKDTIVEYLLQWSVEEGGQSELEPSDASHLRDNLQTFAGLGMYAEERGIVRTLEYIMSGPFSTRPGQATFKARYDPVVRSCPRSQRPFHKVDWILGALDGEALNVRSRRRAEATALRLELDEVMTSLADVVKRSERGTDGQA